MGFFKKSRRVVLIKSPSSNADPVIETKQADYRAEVPAAEDNLSPLYL